MSSVFDSIKLFVADFAITGCIATVVKSLFAPVERTKIILQNQDAAYQVLTGGRKKYTGIFNAVYRIYDEQGLKAFWRGNGTNVIRYFPMQALNFAFNNFYKTCFKTFSPSEEPSIQAFSKFACGGLAGVSSLCAVYPLQLCQVRLAADLGSDSKHKPGAQQVQREFNSLHECLQKISKAEGYRGLYYGFGIAACGIGVYRAFYFGLYDKMKNMVKEEFTSEGYRKPIPVWKNLLLAQSVTLTSGFISYPFDTLGKHMMLQSGRPPELMQYKDTVQCFSTILRERGVPGFYKGAMINMLRGTSGAILLVLYDQVLYYTDWKNKIMKK